MRVRQKVPLESTSMSNSTSNDLLSLTVSYKVAKLWIDFPMTVDLQTTKAGQSTMSNIWLQEEQLQARVAPTAFAERTTSLTEEKRTTTYGSYSGASFASSFDPDNIAPERFPVYSG